MEFGKSDVLGLAIERLRSEEPKMRVEDFMLTIFASLLSLKTKEQINRSKKVWRDFLNDK